MFVRQISVFVQNRSGAITEVLQVLSAAKINIRAFSIADTTDFGVLRMILSDPERAQTVLREHGIAARVNNVLAVRMTDAPGALYAIMTLLSANEISVEYAYAFAAKVDGEAFVIVRTNEKDRAEKIFEEHQYSLLSEEDVANL